MPKRHRYRGGGFRIAASTDCRPACRIAGAARPTSGDLCSFRGRGFSWQDSRTYRCAPAMISRSISGRRSCVELRGAPRSRARRRLQNTMPICAKRPEESQALFSDFLISVTMFFRDQAAFQSLAQNAIHQSELERNHRSPVRPPKRRRS